MTNIFTNFADFEVKINLKVHFFPLGQTSIFPRNAQKVTSKLPC
jgi:hypothetical protein